MKNETKWEFEIRLIASRILSELGANESDIIGCTDLEIAEIESDQLSPLPNSYRAFLKTMGKGAGVLESVKQGAVMYYPKILGLRREVDQLLQLNNFSFYLPPKARVFSMWQGYQFNYFGDATTENPEVFSWEEGDIAPNNCGLFVDYLNDLISHLVLLKIHTAELAQARSQQRLQIFSEASIDKKRELLFAEAEKADWKGQFPSINPNNSIDYQDATWIQDFETSIVWTQLLEICRNHDLDLTMAINMVREIHPELNEITSYALTLAMLQFLLKKSFIEAYHINKPTVPLTMKPVKLMKEIETIWQKEGFATSLNQQIWFREKRR